MTIAAYVLVSCLIISNLVIIFAQKEVPKAIASDMTILDTKIDTDYLQSIVAEHPDYMPAWLRLAEIKARDGNTKDALVILEYARLLDPNSEELMIIERKSRNY